MLQPGGQLLPQPTLGVSLERENWCSVWSADGLVFAWSQGRGVIRLINWCSPASSWLDAEGSDVIDSPEELTKEPLFNPFNDDNFLQRSLSLPDSQITSQRLRRVLHSRWFECSTCVWSLGFSSSLLQVAIDPTSPRLSTRGSSYVLAVGLSAGKIELWEVTDDPFRLYVFAQHTDVVRSVRFSPKSDPVPRLASASRDGSVKILTFHKNGLQLTCLESRDSWAFDVDWSPDGSKVIACNMHPRRNITMYEVATSKIVSCFFGHTDVVSSARFSSDGVLLLSASFDCKAILWDVSTTTQLHTFRLSSDPEELMFLRCCTFTPNDSHVAIVHGSRVISVWNIERPTVAPSLAEIRDGISCTVSPDGSLLSAGTRSGSNVFFRLSVVKPRRLLHMCRSSIRQLCSLDNVNQLPVPRQLRSFLTYGHIPAKTPPRPEDDTNNNKCPILRES